MSMKNVKSIMYMYTILAETTPTSGRGTNISLSLRRSLTGEICFVAWDGKVERTIAILSRNGKIFIHHDPYTLETSGLDLAALFNTASSRKEIFG